MHRTSFAVNVAPEVPYWYKGNTGIPVPQGDSQAQQSPSIQPSAGSPVRSHFNMESVLSQFLSVPAHNTQTFFDRNPHRIKDGNSTHSAHEQANERAREKTQEEAQQDDTRREREAF